MIKFRYYIDMESEQAWLQKMANRGWALQNFFLGFYTFERCEPGQYRYQMDLIEEYNRHKFEEFMDEMDVETVCYWNRWVYLRRDSAKGKFQMYTDAETRINQYQRIKKFYMLILFIEICAFPSIISAAVRMNGLDSIPGGIMTVMASLIVSIIVVLLRTIWKCQFRIEEIRRSNGDI